jgi:hypothetical protein
METYGITVDTLKEVTPITITDASRPSTDAVTAIILMNSAVVNNIAKANGIEVSDQNDATYQVLKLMVIYKSLSDVFAAKNSGTETATFYQNRYLEAQDMLLKYPQHIGQPTAPQRSRVVLYDNANVDTIGTVARKVVGATRSLNRIIVNQ